MRIVLRALVVSMAFGAGCQRTADVGLQITLPQDLVGDTEWFEVGAFEGATCASVLPMLGNGVPDGWAGRVAFRRDEPTSPTFGELPPGRYAFGAVARNATCGVLASGCKVVDFRKSDAVQIAMSATDAPTGECTRGTTCQAGRCVPANDNADPSVGAGCSLELIGAGPLATGSRESGRHLSAPAITATTTGFLIAYHETFAADSVLYLLPIDDSGGALAPEQRALLGRCGGSDDTDGVGLAVTGGSSAVLAMSRPPCQGKAALELLEFETTSDDDPGRPALGGLYGSTSSAPAPIALSSRPLAAQPGGGLVAFTQAGAGHVATLGRGKGVVDPSGVFGDGSGITRAWVAATDRVVAVLAAGDAPAPPVEDVDAGALDVTSGGPALRLVMVPPDSTAAAFDETRNEPIAPIVFPGTWASMTAVGERVIVLSDGVGGGASFAFRTFDMGVDEPVGTDGFWLNAVPGTSAAGTATGDVVVASDRLYIAALAPGTVALRVYSYATKSPTPLAERSLTGEGRIPGVAAIRDGRVAVAATDRRVAVVFTTARDLSTNDPSGGYAVFGCTD